MLLLRILKYLMRWSVEELLRILANSWSSSLSTSSHVMSKPDFLDRHVQCVVLCRGHFSPSPWTFLRLFSATPALFLDLNAAALPFPVGRDRLRPSNWLTTKNGRNQSILSRRKAKTKWNRNSHFGSLKWTSFLVSSLKNELLKWEYVSSWIFGNLVKIP